MRALPLTCMGGQGYGERWCCDWTPELSVPSCEAKSDEVFTVWIEECYATWTVDYEVSYLDMGAHVVPGSRSEDDATKRKPDWYAEGTDITEALRTQV